jgi:hypothetical protein
MYELHSIGNALQRHNPQSLSPACMPCQRTWKAEGFCYVRSVDGLLRQVGKNLVARYRGHVACGVDSFHYLQSWCRCRDCSGTLFTTSGRVGLTTLLLEEKTYVGGSLASFHIWRMAGRPVLSRPCTHRASQSTSKPRLHSAWSQ